MQQPTSQAERRATAHAAANAAYKRRKKEERHQLEQAHAASVLALAENEQPYIAEWFGLALPLWVAPLRPEPNITHPQPQLPPPPQPPLQLPSKPSITHLQPQPPTSSQLPPTSQLPVLPGPMKITQPPQQPQQTSW